MGPENRFVVVICVLGAAILTACLFFAFIVPQTPARIERASAALIPDFGLWSSARSLPVPESGASVGLSVGLFTALAFCAYGAVVYLSWNRRGTARSLTVAFLAALLLWVGSVLALPTVNTDIFDYIAFGRVAAVHNSNPYEVPPSAFPGDPLYPYANPRYRGNPDNKLPLWMLINRGLAEIGGESPVGNLMVYRIAFLLFNLANLSMIVIILRAVHPQAVLSGVVLYGWNPIVAVFAQSKVDTAMVFFLLLALALFVKRREVPAAIPLVLSVLVKLITVPLAAVYWLRDLALRRWRRIAAETLVFAGVTVAVYLSFGGTGLLLDHLNLFGGDKGTSGGAPSAAGPPLESIPRLLLVGALIAVVLWVGLTQDGTRQRLLRGFGLVALTFSLLLADPGSPWYLITLIAVVSVARGWLLAAATVALTFGAFLLNAWQGVSSSDFPLPELVAIPRAIVYLAALCAGVLAAAILMRRRRAQRGAR